MWYKQLTKNAFLLLMICQTNSKLKSKYPFLRLKFITCPKINNVSKIRDEEGFISSFFLYLMSLALYFYLKQ